MRAREIFVDRLTDLRCLPGEHILGNRGSIHVLALPAIFGFGLRQRGTVRLQVRDWIRDL